MVEYLKTKKGYFYKILNNGEKKRISQEEYKKRKTIKMVGGGKNQEEVINELIYQNKYDEWVGLGSNFGLNIFFTYTGKHVPNNYKYYDMYGNIIGVCEVTNKYRDSQQGVEIINIPVFNQILIKDSSHVAQGNFRIVNTNNTLSTYGLATCTGIALNIGTKKFMTHLDASTKISPIINAILKIIDTENIDPKELKPIIYAGRLNSRITLQNAKLICSSVGIPEKNYKVIDVCMMNTVSI